ncbi:hypothetical protein FACS1894184_19660 [Clostridia bacterium]|nr:hypothetical protein FACS1894184_19660 [Clostridia bacterium]
MYQCFSKNDQSDQMISSNESAKGMRCGPTVTPLQKSGMGIKQRLSYRPGPAGMPPWPQQFSLP